MREEATQAHRALHTASDWRPSSVVLLGSTRAIMEYGEIYLFNSAAEEGASGARSVHYQKSFLSSQSVSAVLSGHSVPDGPWCSTTRIKLFPLFSLITTDVQS